MLLTLTLAVSEQLSAQQSKQCTFSTLGGYIGRHTDNDFVLFDENRYISGKHARIEFDHNQFYIVDQSTNGVSVNQKMLDSGNRVAIMHGDKIEIGTFQLLVEVVTDHDSTDNVIQAQPLSTQMPVDDNNFNIATSLDPALASRVKIAPFEGEDDLSDLDAILGGGSRNDNKVNPPQIPPSPAINGQFTPPNVIPDDWDIFADESLANVSPLTSAATSPHKTHDEHNNPTNQPPSVADTRNQTQANPQAKANNATLLEAFCQGAGINVESLKTTNPEALMQKIGEITRMNTDGLMQLLQARSTVKSNFRLGHTMITPRENNPLKFSISAAEALKILLSDDQLGYLSTFEAYDQSYKDLQAHQLAVMAGMQSTLRSFIDQLEPERLEQIFDSQARSGLISGNKKAKYWEQYCDYHSQFIDSVAEDFEDIFGEKFAEAYAEQIKKMQ